MKKNNVIIFGLLALISVFLLWLWYYLGLNAVDEPFDLILSIVWWAIMVVAIVIIVNMERIRRRRIRTVYVGDRAVFNSERGLMGFASIASMPDVIASVLQDLRYDFSRVDFPDRNQFDVRYFVRTSEFDLGTQEDVQQVHDLRPVGQSPISSYDAQETQKVDGVASSRPSFEGHTWKGEVVIVATQEQRRFETPQELATILVSLEGTAA